MKGYVYILQSEKNGRFYIGSTSNINHRIKVHKSGGVRATKGMLPVNLLLAQEYSTFQEARSIEIRLKRFKRKDYLERIIRDKIIKMR